jgi:hypothetical protein
MKHMPWQDRLSYVSTFGLKYSPHVSHEPRFLGNSVTFIFIRRTVAVRHKGDGWVETVDFLNDTINVWQLFAILKIGKTTESNDVHNFFVGTFLNFRVVRHQEDETQDGACSLRE